MPVTRRAVLEKLAAESDATGGEMTTMAALASALEVSEEAVATEIDGLVACELAVLERDGRVRVTVTGEELLELDTDKGVILDLASK